MYKLVYIVFAFAFAFSLSAQKTATEKSQSQRLEDILRAEEEYGVASGQIDQKSTKVRQTNEERNRRIFQIETVNNEIDHTTNISAINKELQILLDQTQTIELPPLSVFLDAAYENSSIKRQEAVLDEKRINYKITQRQWLNYFRINGSYSYGIFNSLNNRSDLESQVLTFSGTAQNSYSIGAGVTISLGDLFTQKQKRQAQKSIMLQAQYQYDQTVEERKLMILNAYNAVVEQLATIKAKAEAAAMYNAQMRISENEFVNGQISLIALSLERSRRTGAMVTFQECKIQLHNAITLLELLTNVKILSNNK